MMLQPNLQRMTSKSSRPEVYATTLSPKRLKADTRNPKPLKAYTLNCPKPETKPLKLEARVLRRPEFPRLLGF